MQSFVRTTVQAGKGQLLKATSRAVPLGNAADLSEPAVTQEDFAMPKVQPVSVSSMAQTLPKGLIPKAISGLSTTPTYRYMSAVATDSIGRKIGEVNAEALPGSKTPHTDMEVPDFSDYRKSATSDPNRDSTEAKTGSLNFQYALTGLTIGGSGYIIINSVLAALNFLAPDRQTLSALGNVEVKIGDIPEGKNLVFKWQGKPVFVRHRTAAEIAEVEAVDVATLRDPQTDAERVQDPAWLVVIGICTHLGCVPMAGAGSFGGYYCPCHGSHYDCSGRIRKGPAPANLEVPDYFFKSEDLLLIGEKANAS